MEALVSILIFSFGVLGLIGLEASAVNYSVDAEDRNRAALFASEVASYMWLQGSVSMTTTSAQTTQMTAWTTAIADPTTPMGLPGGTLAIHPTGTGNSTDIVISWIPKTDNANFARTRQLTTRVILP